MKKFLIRVFVFFGILILFKLLQTGLVLSDLSSKDASNFYGTNTSKNRIILVGSSNLDFNYDYGKLKKHFEDYDIIGCNLNEPSGLYATLFKLKKLNPKKDDIIVFCLPHSLYEPEKLIPLGSSGKKGFSNAMVSKALVDFPQEFLTSIINIKTTDTYKLLKEGEKFKEAINELQFSATTEADELPDFLACKKLDGQFSISSTGFDETYLLKIQEYINTSFDAEIYFRYPVVKQSEFVVSQKRIDFLKNNYPFINEFEDAIYMDKFWYNQWYHLNFCGRELSTEKLIRELRNQLNQKL